MNNKIVIVIQHCLDEGLQSKYTTCSGYDRKVTDMRKFLIYTKGTELIHTIKFEKDYWIMCCIKPDPNFNSGSGYRAAWIFFPVTINVGQKEIDDVVTVAEKQIKCNEYDDNELKNIVEKYSQSAESVSYNIPLSQDGIAIRYVDDGHESLFYIYGKIYQKEFTRYEWVILTNRAATNIEACSSLKDITANSLLNSHIISLSKNDFGFIPYLDGQEFRNPIRITDDDTLVIEWRKDGYLPIQKKGQKESDFEIRRDEIEKIFQIYSIKVTDKETDRTLRAYFQFNTGRWSDDHKLVYIKEGELSTVTVKVSADNYETETIPLNLSNQVVNPIEVRLQPQKHTYVFIIPLSHGGYTKTEPITLQKTLAECPFEGYKCRDRIHEGENYVRYVGKETNKSKTTYPQGGNNEGQGVETYHSSDDGHHPSPKPKKEKWYKRFNWNVILVLCVFALIIVLGYAGYNKKSQTKNVSKKTDYSVNKSTWEAAKAYLDSCQNKKQAKWIKSEMEQYDELRGLYEHINNYEFKEIVSILDKHKDEFMGYDEYQRLYDIASNYSNKRGQFSKDGTITFDNYLRKDFASMTNANTETIPDASKDDDPKEQKPQEHHSSSKTGQNNPASKTSKGSSKTNTSNNQDNNI